PGFEYLQGVLLHARMRICDWRDHAAGLASLAARIEKGERASSGFSALSLFPSPQLQRRSAEIVVADRYPPDPSLGPIPRPTAARRKLRVGYFSADFYAHATSYLIAGLLEAHDRSRIEVLGFSFGPDHQDEMRLRISSACDRFVDVREASDTEVARMSRDSGVDIAVDLKGLTQDSRPGIFALRAAPLQVSYLGFPGTMGADYIDYLIADRIVVPEHNQRYYSEKLVYLPDCYQVNDARRAVSERHFTRAELGLPESGFVFCCFNSNYKITPEMLDSWVRILQQVEGSVLWLLQDNSTAARNLRREARLRGLDERRLVFAQKLPIAEHLARQKVANLFLDTSPYNAHTTASDALWAGLPLLTLEGPAFHGRVASSLLACIGLPELVTSTMPAYEATAIALARNPEALATLRSRLWRNRLQSPLFNTSLFARHIEDAYARMYERHCQGLAPDTLHIDRPAAG
ncbi:MAG TPA: hypothetical protein VLW55_07130, partial [Burkholderiaceae bacterium]|nr:hypothetical protein [Burkholderiaceae bacterium]